MTEPTLRPGWARVRFGDVVRLNTDRCADPEREGIERYVGIEHIEPEDLRLRRWGLVADGTTFTNLFRPGQVLFAKRRAYQRKVAVPDFEGVCSGDIYVFEPSDDRLLPALLPFLCQTEGFFAHALSTSAGSLSPRTDWQQLAQYEFALPPVPEQQRIASVLGAFQGLRVTIQAVAEACVRVYTGCANETFAPHGFGPSPHPRQWSPDHWSLCPLDELVDEDAPVCYGIVQPGPDVEDGVPTLAIKDLRGDFSTNIHHTSPDIESRYVRSRVKGGDVLLSIKATIGEIAVVPASFSGNITRDLARLRLRAESVTPIYFTHLYRSMPFRRYVTSLLVGSTRAELSIAQLKGMAIPLPAVSAQLQISSRLSAVEHGLRTLTERRTLLTGVQQRVLNALLFSSPSAHET
jgi:type I restriction enzyme S subunit